MSNAAIHRMARPKHRPALRDRGWYRMLETLAAVGLLAGTGYLIYLAALQADNFTVRELRIYGLHRLDEYAIAEASGINDSSNLLFLNPELAARQIEALAGVERCEVSRVFPDTIRIEIVEREPHATVLLDNRAYLIDENAVVLRELSQSDPLFPPFITALPDLHLLAVGQAIDSRPLQDALAVLRAFQGTVLADEISVSEIAARHENDLRLYTEELSYEIRWGRGDFEHAARRLEGLWLSRNKVIGCEEYLDLRFGTDLACK